MIVEGEGKRAVASAAFDVAEQEEGNDSLRSSLCLARLGMAMHPRNRECHTHATLPSFVPP